MGRERKEEAGSEKCNNDIYEDFCKCYDLANRMDSMDPNAPGTFVGSVSERLTRAFERLLKENTDRS